MSRIIVLIPTGTNVGLASVSLGVIHTMERKGVHLGVFKPIAQPRIGGDTPDQTTTTVHANSSTTTATEPLKVSYVEGLLSSNQKNMLMEGIITNYHANTKDAEVVLVEGLVPTCKHQFAQSLNYEIAKILDAKVVLVMSQSTGTPEQLKKRIELTRNSFGSAKNTNITSVIVNKLNAPVDEQDRTRPDLSEIFDDSTRIRVNNIGPAKLQESGPLPVLGAVPWSFDLIMTRAIDMARRLSVTVINEGDTNTRRVKSVTLYARSAPHILEYFRAGSLLVTSAGRLSVLIATCLAAMNDVEVGALLLTGGYGIDARISKLCERAFATDLPIFIVNTSTWRTSLSLQSFNLEVPVDDHEHIEKVQECVANYISADWIDSLTATSERSRRLSPPAFRYQLIKFAHRTGKRIVLPEGDKPHTVKVAAICTEHGTTTYVLLDNPAGINRVATSQGIELGASIEIADPEVVRENYVGHLVELRKNKGMTETVARKQLEDNVILDTLILGQDEVDGLVSGAAHTTANTVRPSLRLIKTAPDSSLVSSVSFMLLPEQVYVYGDCIINLDPTAEQPVEIAIQSANSATAFGIEPRAAVLSYSTGISGAGSDVEKVCETARLAQEKRPDLMIDGPLQYGAAMMTDVAKSKASNSPVADRVTMFTLPGLSTDDTTYKAIQRSANLISIGPMLQGICKPVNGLSRDALVDDVVYAIALTVIQSAQQQ